MKKVSGEVALKKKRKGITSREWALYGMCFIPMLLVFVFNYLPMGGLVIAFKNYKYSLGIFGSEWVGFKNFEFFLTSNDFVRLVRNTVGLNAVFIVTGMASAIILAIMLFELKSRLATKTFQTVLLTPHFLSWVVAAYMLYAFLHPTNGILNQFLENTFGMEPVDWYAKPGAWPLILTIASIWKHVAMDSILYYASLMAVDSSLFEAAKIDGATKMQINWHIVIPSLVPLITILTIMKIGGIFNADFGLFYQLPRDIGTLYPTTDVINTYVFRTMRVIGDMGMSSAVGFLQSIVGFVLVVITNKVSKAVSDISLF